MHDIGKSILSTPFHNKKVSKVQGSKVSICKTQNLHCLLCLIWFYAKIVLPHSPHDHKSTSKMGWFLMGIPFDYSKQTMFMSVQIRTAGTKNTIKVFSLLRKEISFELFIFHHIWYFSCRGIIEHKRAKTASWNRHRSSMIEREVMKMLTI